MTEPAATARTAATTARPVEASSSRAEAMMPTRPKAAKPTGPTHGRRRDAEPSAAPISSEMITMPTIRAGLSPVLKMLMAVRATSPPAWSMKALPTLPTSDWPVAAHPVTTSPTASAMPAATAPAICA